MVLENGPEPDCLWADNKKLAARVHGVPLKWPGVQKRPALHSLHRLNFIFSNQLHRTMNICKALRFICLFCHDNVGFKRTRSWNLPAAGLTWFCVMWQIVWEQYGSMTSHTACQCFSIPPHARFNCKSALVLWFQWRGASSMHFL